MDLRIILFDALSNRPQFKLNSLFADERQRDREKERPETMLLPEYDRRANTV